MQGTSIVLSVAHWSSSLDLGFTSQRIHVGPDDVTTEYICFDSSMKKRNAALHQFNLKYMFQRQRVIFHIYVSKFQFM